MNQYFSKYRNAWIDFATPPTPGQIQLYNMARHYHLIQWRKANGVKNH